MRNLTSFACVVVLSGCSTLAVHNAVENCKPGGLDCSPEQAAILPLPALRAFGPTLVVACPQTKVIDEAYRADCVRRVSTMAQALTHRFPGDLQSVDASRAEYREGGFYADTFISGREGEDYIRKLVVTQPLPWHP